MKINQIIALSLFVLAGGVQAQDTTPAKLPGLKPGEAVATFAGGCCWAHEEAFDQLKGVREVISGYSGGIVKQPTYRLAPTRPVTPKPFRFITILG